MRWFVFVLLTLAAFRVQRIVTRDDWPPSELLRESVREAFGEASGWYKLLTCAWCFGTWVTFVVFALASIWLHLEPHWGLQAAAASGVVGLLDSWDR